MDPCECNSGLRRVVKSPVGQPVPARPRPPWQAIASIVFALTYGASPVDVIPDVLPLLGWIDDGIVGGLMLTIAVFSFIRHNRARRQYARVQVRK